MISHRTNTKISDCKTFKLDYVFKRILEQTNQKALPLHKLRMIHIKIILFKYISVTLQIQK